MEQLPRHFPNLGGSDNKQLTRYGPICAAVSEKIRGKRIVDAERAVSGIYSVIKWEIGRCRPRRDNPITQENIWST